MVCLPVDTRRYNPTRLPFIARLRIPKVVVSVCLMIVLGHKDFRGSQSVDFLRFSV
jgi:hypothetical protein